jgi:hypothetical protein
VSPSAGRPSAADRPRYDREPPREPVSTRPRGAPEGAGKPRRAHVDPVPRLAVVEQDRDERAPEAERRASAPGKARRHPPSSPSAPSTSRASRPRSANPGFIVSLVATSRVEVRLGCAVLFSPGRGCPGRSASRRYRATDPSGRHRCPSCRATGCWARAQEPSYGDTESRSSRRRSSNSPISWPSWAGWRIGTSVFTA